MWVMTMSWIDLVGYVASASVLATFCMSTMVPLRTVAICSNILFAIFGALAHVYPVLVLHLVLFPVNGVRLMQALSPSRRVGGSRDPSTSISARDSTDQVFTVCAASICCAASASISG
jgi:hypothetical protein